MGEKHIFRRASKKEKKCCLNCKHATEHYLQQPFGICMHAEKILKKDKIYSCIRDMGIEPCWEEYDGSTSCDEKE